MTILPLLLMTVAVRPHTESTREVGYLRRWIILHIKTVTEYWPWAGMTHCPYYTRINSE